MKKRLLRTETREGPLSLLTDGASVESVSDPTSRFQIEIFPSMKCNVNCPSCDRGKDRSELKDFRDITRLYEALRKEATFNDANFRITGGEPTLYPKINELIDFLFNINPYSKVDLITNGIELARIKVANRKKINLYVSIYPHTAGILNRSKAVRHIMRSGGRKLAPNILFHEDMGAPGTKRRPGIASGFCLSAVLLGGTGRVYPCCRAHRLEQDHKKNYHLRINTPGLYKKLKAIIDDTDMCGYCPRAHDDSAKVRL